MKQLPSDLLKVRAGGSVERRGHSRPSAAPGEAVTGDTSRREGSQCVCSQPWGAGPKARCCGYPVSWLGLTDSKGLAPGCPAKGMCQVQVQDPGCEADPIPKG